MRVETRRERALFAARLHVRQGVILSAEAIADIAAELLATRDEADLVARENEGLRTKLDVKTRPRMLIHDDKEPTT